MACTETCVTLYMYGKLMDMNENQSIFTRIIEAYLLKIARKIVYSDKRYDKQNWRF